MIWRHRAATSYLAHVVLFALAFFLSFALYYNLRGFDLWLKPYYLPLLPLVVFIKTVVFARTKVFRASWRYVGIRDLYSLSIATLISTSIFILCYVAIANWIHPPFFDRNIKPQFPESVFPLDFITTVAVVGGVRMLFRLYNEEIRPAATSSQRPCLILGAGDTGEALLREILRMRMDHYRVVGFLDDNPTKQGTRIHDVPILGRLDQVKAFCEQYQIRELLLAMPSAPHKKLRQIVEQCEGMNVLFRTIPAMGAVIEGKVTVSQIRDVDIKDLLGREQIELDEVKISEYIRDEQVLVTGAGGSIGSELCRQIARYRPNRLVLVERAENNLFEIDRDLEREFPGISRVCYVADICDARRVEAVLQAEQPAIIFHAAAHKHVPMMEINVGEAIKNNVHGTKVVADAAKRHKIRRFVMISTDKAVNPTSVMGCTKRVAEMYIQQLRGDGVTQFMTVRFGNVLGSSGSVIPIFQKQIAEGGPVTVTDPRMTRYFMTIPEASQLVLQAGVMGKDGDIFVLDMGEPVKIVDLARDMITLSGLRPGEDIEIKYSGIRPGEKLYEELSVTGENMGKTTHEKIYVWRNRKEDWQRVCRTMEKLVSSADELSHDDLRERMAEIVPEYKLDEPIQSHDSSEVAASATPEPAQPEESAGSRTLPFGESPIA